MTQTAYVIIPLPNDPALIELQNRLKAIAPDLAWIDPSAFHVTLTYSDVVSDLAGLINGLPAEVQHFPINIKTLGTFENGSSRCVFARVEPSTELWTLQASIAAVFETTGAVLSPFSASATWQPHITLAYLPEGAPFLVPMWNGDIWVAATAIELCTEEDGAFTSLYRSKAHAPRTQFSVWKSASGTYRWKGISSVNTIDRDDEIVTKAALEKDVARTEAEGDTSTLRLYHISHDIGPAPDFRAVAHGHLVEMGEFYKTPEAEAVARMLIRYPKAFDGLGWGESIKFLTPDRTVFDDIVITERSILPLSGAANPFTDLTIEGNEAMPVDKAQMAFLKQMETDPDLADAARLFLQAEEQSKALDQKGVIRKSAKVKADDNEEESPAPDEEETTTAEGEDTDPEEEEKATPQKKARKAADLTIEELADAVRTHVKAAINQELPDSGIVVKMATIISNQATLINHLESRVEALEKGEVHLKSEHETPRMELDRLLASRHKSTLVKTKAEDDDGEDDDFDEDEDERLLEGAKASQSQAEGVWGHFGFVRE